MCAGEVKNLDHFLYGGVKFYSFCMGAGVAKTTVLF
jgi:hypothetical protein